MIEKQSDADRQRMAVRRSIASGNIVMLVVRRQKWNRNYTYNCNVSMVLMRREVQITNYRALSTK